MPHPITILGLGDPAPLHLAQGRSYRDHSGGLWHSAERDDVGCWYLTDALSGSRERFLPDGRHWAAPGSSLDLAVEVPATIAARPSATSTLRIVVPTAPPAVEPGAGARFASSCHALAERAPETYDQADVWAEDVVRREFGDPSGLGIAFAEPGEMERRTRDEFWPDAMRIDPLLWLALAGYAAAAVVAAIVAYPLLEDWFR